MALGPIDYGAMQSQLDVSPLLQGLQVHDANAERKLVTQQRQQAVQLAQSKFTQQQLQDQDYKAALADYTANPTAQKLLAMSAQFPEHQAALEAGFKTYTAGQQQDLIGTATRTLGALANGRPDLAEQALTERRDALKNSGIDTSQTDAALELAKSSDPAKHKQGIALMGMVLSGGLGADTGAKLLQTFGLDAGSQDKAADNARQQAQFEETQRHNRAVEGTEAANAATSRGQLALSQKREGRVAAGGGKGGAKAKLPSGFILD